MKTFVGILLANFLVSPLVRAEPLMDIFGASQAKYYVDLSAKAGKLSISPAAGSKDRNETSNSPAGTVLKVFRPDEANTLRALSKLITKPDGTQVSYSAYYNYYDDDETYPSGASLTDATYISADPKGRLLSVASCHGSKCMAMSAERCATLKKKIDRIFPKWSETEKQLDQCDQLTAELSGLMASGADSETRKAIQGDIRNLDPVAKRENVDFDGRGVGSNLSTMYGWAKLCAKGNFADESTGTKTH